MAIAISQLTIRKSWHLINDQFDIKKTFIIVFRNYANFKIINTWTKKIHLNLNCWEKYVFVYLDSKKKLNYNPLK